MSNLDNPDIVERIARMERKLDMLFNTATPNFCNNHAVGLIHLNGKDHQICVMIDHGGIAIQFPKESNIDGWHQAVDIERY